MFDWIDAYMDATGCDWDTAVREYDAIFNPDYDPDDYDDPYGYNGSDEYWEEED